MRSWLFSLVLGRTQGIAYGLLLPRLPAPPRIALVGLLDMLLSEQVVAWRRHNMAAPAAPVSSLGGGA